MISIYKEHIRKPLHRVGNDREKFKVHPFNVLYAKEIALHVTDKKALSTGELHDQI